MSFAIATDRVRERAGLSDTSQDPRINSLIAEFLPTLQRILDPVALADEGLHALLSLGATELVAAEMLSILSREEGRRDVVVIGDVRLEPAWDDGAGLRAQGERRLAPFLRRDLVGRSSVGSIGEKSGTGEKAG